MKLKTGRIDKVIQSFKFSPKNFEDNVWNCYSECKEAIPLVDNHEEYSEYIDYIAAKLKI